MVQFVKDGIGSSIIAAIKAQIHDGHYKPGDRLPSTRAFAAEWGTSRTTVTAAYNQLIAEGYLITKPGARAIVSTGLQRAEPASPSNDRASHRLSAFASRLLKFPILPAGQAARIADFRYGDLSGMDFPMLAWKRALNKAQLRRTPRLRYGDPQGLASLRVALQGYLWRSRGINCTPEQIIVVNGSQQGLDLCARLLLDPGDFFLMENPGYLLARQAFVASGGIEISVPVDQEGLRTDDLPAARLAYVTPSHQFPLGGVLSATRRRALLAWAKQTGACIVEDDYDGEYRHDIAPIPPLQTLDPARVIYVGTCSKTLSPTLRLGYLVVPTPLRRAFTDAKRLTDRHTPHLEQEALADVLANGAYDRHVRRVRRRNAERREVLLKSLADHLGPSIVTEGAGTGLHLVIWFKNFAADREGEIQALSHAAGTGLHPVSTLYHPSAPRPAQAGFIMGYAGLSHDAIMRGIGALATAIAAR
ncbi:GntR family transcriptional regulator/MocR family aminotransferase [Rhodoligotrophos appendicifer]|uniref:MocR-like pyridoxine biosynthesis transcription factor PdxR n=1 Tax=Rhodoligotrophos appendicifer TaxID=987056 RepID=UPI001FE3685B|nr:PLP-dependent aminotransferase family protein [Rhodoligotrophos appendicifer]